MNKIVFATNNQHKLQEVKAILGNSFEIIGLKELGCFDDIPETAETLEGNALLKAEYIYKKFGIDCFADDTGLEIDVLNGAPGVYSARFAGEECDAQKNMQKVLDLMKNTDNRNACFRTVAALVLNGEKYFFEGKILGKMGKEARGNTGFGYDPIFIPDGYDKTFAELGEDEKNKISHRALAVRKLAEFLFAQK